MMRLKDYQNTTLNVLRRFLETCRVAGPTAAYDAVINEPDQKARLGRYADRYRPLDGLPDVPYVCLRLPTGGGKTLLAAHSVAVARDAWIEKDFPVVLWLVTSTTIRLQTVEALKKPTHPYRVALDDAFKGRVRVFDIADMTHIRPQDVRDACCVVVGTIQTLRVNNTDGRKVYAHNENFESHFAGVSPTHEGLERIEDGPGKGGIRFSFANLMHLHRPLMIVDEAHNAVTGLTHEMRRRLNPSAIIEFTATPREKNNTLHNVTAMELKREDMIKLPIMLSEHTTWQNAVNGAIASRAALADTAKTERGYLRPIVLFQAQPKDQEVTVEVLKKHLIEVEQVDERKIAVATGDQRELDGINLFDKECRIEYVITVVALKAGWDCSFAYVFCSVANIRSATNVEQLLGRVLRMPYAERRKTEALNRAYAHVSETNFAQAAEALRDRLIDMGFDDSEAEDCIEPAQPDLDLPGGLFGTPRAPTPKLTVRAPQAPSFDDLPEHDRYSVDVRDADDGAVDVIVTGPISADVEARIIDALPEDRRAGFRDEVRQHRQAVERVLSPAERGETFTLPALVAEVQGELELADTDSFEGASVWSILDHPATLSEDEFAVRETARSFEIDLDGQRVTYHFASEDEQLSLDIDVQGWSAENLVIWLDRQVRSIQILPSDMLCWLRAVVRDLTERRNIPLSALMRCKFILARKLKEKIAAIRKTERAGSYQACLFAPTARVEISFDDGFTFRKGIYTDVPRYKGHYRFVKHFLGPNHVPAFDGALDGEEFKCAQALDSLPMVKHWLRNVSRHPASFWLPTATDRFYPDFVAELTDGRFFVLDYKSDRDKEDTEEKQTIGQLWETVGKGKGVFQIVKKTVNNKDPRAQMMARLSP
jgi:type III restriction enzyme